MLPAVKPGAGKIDNRQTGDRGKGGEDRGKSEAV